MNPPDTLKQHEGPFRTKMGAVFIGERAVFRGVDPHLAFKDASWMDLYVYGITGKRLAANQLRVLEGLWTCSSYPDGRLWNNRVAALAGSTRSYGGAGVSAALMVSDAAIIGRQVDCYIADLLVRTLLQMRAGADLETLIRDERSRNRIIKGYGRTMHPERIDERLPVAQALLQREGIEPGPHFQLAFEIERVLSGILGRYLPMTYSTVITAIALDFGLTPRECYFFDYLLFVAGMPPCYLEALEKPEGASFVLRCERIDYTGPARRSWE
jgi:hypothetical protein